MRHAYPTSPADEQRVPTHPAQVALVNVGSTHVCGNRNAANVLSRLHVIDVGALVL